MMLREGSVVRGDIVLEQELGRGGMGVVWTANHRGLGVRVAVKVLHASGLAGEEARTRFQREAKVIARIDSPHVVRIFDAGLTDDAQPFIVMELLQGRDLKARIQESGPMSSAEVAALLSQSCAALGKAHELGIVHRDIKPANIFLGDAGGGRPHVKLLDFGIAKANVLDGAALTMTEALVGTPYYMSPEQFIDARNIDARSDLWSLAVVAYACLTGKLPFAGESVGALALETHSGEFAPVREARPDLPPALDAWFRRALDPDPDKRYQTATELASSFERASQGVAQAQIDANQRSAPAASQWAGSQPTQGQAQHASSEAQLQMRSPPVSPPVTPGVHAEIPTQTGVAPSRVVEISDSREGLAAPPRSRAPMFFAAALAVLGGLALMTVYGYRSGLLGGTVSPADSRALDDSVETGSSASTAESAAHSAEVVAASSTVEPEPPASTTAIASIVPSASASGSATVSAPSTSTAVATNAAAGNPIQTPAPTAKSFMQGYRPRNMKCTKGKDFCHKCCMPGDRLSPFPDCSCYWKP